MHAQQVKFFEGVRDYYPERFKNTSVIDIGSRDVNGNNRYLFTNCTYLGLDIIPGPNVDIVTPAHLFKTEVKYNIVISSECLEHDKYYALTLLKMFDLCTNNGLILMSCAGPSRPEHGTTHHCPGDSPGTHDYYRNLSKQDIKDTFNLQKLFWTYHLGYSHDNEDLYFWGIKHA